MWKLIRLRRTQFYKFNSIRNPHYDIVGNQLQRQQITNDIIDYEVPLCIFRDCNATEEHRYICVRNNALSESY